MEEMNLPLEKGYSRKAFCAEMERYLKSGNDVPVSQATLKAEELRLLLDHIYELERLWSIAMKYEE
jgi:hypothetical protein